MKKISLLLILFFLSFSIIACNSEKEKDSPSPTVHFANKEESDEFIFLFLSTVNNKPKEEVFELLKKYGFEFNEDDSLPDIMLSVYEQMDIELVEVN